jgi:ComF family protein
MVHGMKFGPDRTVATLIAGWLDNCVSYIDVDVVVPVPTAPVRVRQRGFDHTALLAKEFARCRSLPYSVPLRRVGKTRQVGTNRKLRQEQLKNAYTLTNIEAIKNKKVLVIDDVTTTGATLSEVARVLRRNGAKLVDGLVFVQTL